MKLAEFRKRIENEQKLRMVSTPFRELEFTAVEDKVNLRGIPLSDECMESIYKKLNISSRYAGKFPAELMIPHIQYQAAKNPYMATLAYDGDDLAGITLKTFNPLYTDDILDAVELTIGEKANIDKIHYSVSDSNFWITNGIQAEPRVGDITKAGIRVKNSLLSEYRPELSLVAERLVCTNGMTRSDTIMRFDVEEKAELPVMITKLWDMASDFVNSIVVTDSVAIDSNPIAITAFLYKHGIGTRMISKVLAAVSENNPKTLYDLINILTYIGSHQCRGTYMQHHLQSLGAQLTMEFDTCGTCHNILV